MSEVDIPLGWMLSFFFIAISSCAACEGATKVAHETHRWDGFRACVARFTPAECREFRP